MAEKKSYLKQLIEFYFAPKLRSFFTVLYLIFFGYFIVFYFDNTVLAFKFIWDTIVSSTTLLDIAYLFWGSCFIIALIIPFSASVYVICLPYEIYKKDWERAKKLLMVVLVVLATVDIILAMDKSIRYITERPELNNFVVEQHLYITR